ncbi:hypothetical protein GWK08_05200 [Leptobacterium flavescens]|uniref:Uncharacterized protein n=1 Tax=Leptobacterium flavescens TaxID=472055 RepID=A0A6P0UQY5_9FLAO|nr:hypothetical protein [Leptobacterium flavescens]NER12826.1 hypothetical protein [Leptobacterium flavescens]
MKKIKKNVGIGILITWVAFFMWELQVQKWIDKMEEPVMRLDLVIILPGILLMTLYFLLKN